MIVIDPCSLRVVDRIRVGRTAWNVAFASEGSRASLSNFNDNTVSVIDTARRNRLQIRQGR